MKTSSRCFPNDKGFVRFSMAEYDSKGQKTAFPILLGSFTETPFRNVAVNWSHIFGPSLINEVLVGYNSINNVNWLNDWGGIGNANATFGIPGGQPLPGLSAINWGSGLTTIGAAATLEDNLPKGYQLNEKLTWIKGRHSLKFGGQFLRYVQRRYYAGNNGALGTFVFNGTFTGVPFADFLLDQVQNKGRGGGDRDNPWTHLTNRISLYVQSDLFDQYPLTMSIGQLAGLMTNEIIELDKFFPFSYGERGHPNILGGTPGSPAFACRRCEWTIYEIEPIASQPKLSPWVGRDYCTSLLNRKFRLLNFPILSDGYVFHAGGGILRNARLGRRAGNAPFGMCAGTRKTYGPRTTDDILYDWYAGRLLLKLTSDEYEKYLKGKYKTPFDKLQDPLDENLLFVPI